MVWPKHLNPIIAIITAAFLTGCATNPTPDPAPALAEAEIHIKHAREAGARQQAELELHRAEQELVKAQSAAEEDEHGNARRLAEKAAVDAQYAALTAETKTLQSTMQEIRNNLRLLEQEMNDNPSEADNFGDSHE